GMDGARALRDQTEKQRFSNYRAGAGAVVVLDPNDGSVVAMASNPTYDPRQFAAGITPEEFQQLNRPESNFPLVNRATQGLYAPGSTFKLFTAIAGLQTGQVDPNAGFYDQGCLHVGHEPTGVGLRDEPGGRVPDQLWKEKFNQNEPDARRKREGSLWLPGDNVNLAVGQGDLLVTPLQLASGYAAFANGGTLFTPRLAS